MMASFRKRSLLLSGICLINLIITNVHSFSASQYLGAQSNNRGEHLLLFELPNSISSRLFRNSPVQGNHHHPSLSEAPGHNIDLTIPISNIQPVERQHQEAQIYRTDRYPVGPRVEPAASQQQRQLESLLAEYERNSLQPEQQEYQPKVRQNQLISNLTGGLEQQVRQYVYQHQQRQKLALQHQYQPEENHPQPVLSYPPPASYYPSVEPEAEVHSSDYNNNKITSGYNNSNSNSLLEKLASSSPELLHKLKSFIQQANVLSVDQKLVNKYKLHEPAKTLYTRDYSAAESQQEGSKYQNVYTDKDRSLEHSTLQNLTSHEEIKIPMVVIAMPRILTSRKEQQGASASNNSSLSNFITSALANITTGSEHNNNTSYRSAVASKLFDLARSDGQGGNLTVNNLASRQNLSHYMNSNHAMALEATTSAPLHTMAPYAQQFSLPLAPSTGQQAYYPNNDPFYQTRSETYQVAPNATVHVEQPSFIYQTSQQQPQQSPREPEVAEPEISQPVKFVQVEGGQGGEQSIRHRVELITNYLRQKPFLDQQQQQQQPQVPLSNDFHVIDLAPPSHYSQAGQSQNNPPAPVHFEQASSEPRQSLFVPYSALQQVYNLQGQQQQNRKQANVSSEATYSLYNGLNPLPSHHQMELLGGRSIISRPSAAVNLIESSASASSLAKLRPLFQTIERRAASEASSSSMNKLSNGQLVDLFEGESKLRSRRHQTTSERGRISSATTVNELTYGRPGGANGGVKKTPKMVVMII